MTKSTPPEARKVRVEVGSRPGTAVGLFGAPTAAGVRVVDEKPGQITWVDRAKGYLHTVFATVSAVAVLVIEVAPDLNALPGLPPDVRHWVTVAVVIANAVATRKVSNQDWRAVP